MQRLALLILVTGFLAGPAAAHAGDQENAGDDARDTFNFESHDTNDDGYITEAEWEDAGNAANDFSRVDADNDGYLDEDEIRSVQDAGMDPGQITPEEDYLGTGQDPLSADPADNEPVSQETEAAASGGIDRGARRDAGRDETEQDSAAQTSAIDNSLFETGESGDELSVSQLDASGDGRVSRQEAEQDGEARENFVAWDDNQDGYLDEEEIDAGQQGNDGGRGQQDISFETQDANDDDRIDAEEAPESVDFETLDSNNDGYLDEGEVNYDPSERTTADAAGFRDLDTDNDARLSRGEAANNTYFDANFDTWDADQDGYLEEEEVNDGWLEESSATPDEIW